MILLELTSMNILFIFGISVFGYIVGYIIGRLSLIKNLKAHAKIGSLININNTLYKITKTDVLEVKKYETFGINEDGYFIINTPKPPTTLKNRLIRMRNYIYTIKRSFTMNKKKTIILIDRDFKRDIEWPDPPKPYDPNDWSDPTNAEMNII